MAHWREPCLLQHPMVPDRDADDRGLLVFVGSVLLISCAATVKRFVTFHCAINTTFVFLLRLGRQQRPEQLVITHPWQSTPARQSLERCIVDALRVLGDDGKNLGLP